MSMLPRNSLAMILDDPGGRPVEELAEALESEIADLSEAERYAFDQALKTIGSGAQTALPGVVQGASTGAALGPWGALVGGLAGGATSLASGAVRKPRTTPRPRPVMSAPQTTPPTVSTAPAAVTTMPPSLGGNPAAQLLAVIQNPTTLQALAALVAGPSGLTQVPVGNTTAPPGAFLNLLTTLATQAATQVPPTAAGHDAYLRGADGEYAWDTPSPEARAQALLTQLMSRGGRARPPASSQSAGEWLLRAGLAEMVDTPLL